MYQGIIVGQTTTAGIEPATIGSEGWSTRSPEPSTCCCAYSRSCCSCSTCCNHPQFASRLASRQGVVVRLPQAREAALALTGPGWVSSGFTSRRCRPRWRRSWPSIWVASTAAAGSERQHL